jgi:hypothetical protein
MFFLPEKSNWVLHLPRPTKIRGVKVQLLLSRISYGLALFFLVTSNLLVISREIPFAYWVSNWDYIFWRHGIAIFVQSGLLILALVLAKKKLFGILIIGVNAFIVLVRFVLNSPWSYMEGAPLGMQFRWYVKIMMGHQSMGPEFPWSFAEYIKILSAILTIAGVIFAFSISNKNLPISSPASVKPTPLQTRVTPKTPTGITGDAVEQVEKLGNLLAKGLLTQEEFDSKKKQILGL